jgi:chromate transporter
VAGPVGGVVAALAIFLPCYLFVILFGPSFRRIAKYRSVQAFVQGITATVIGAIAGAAVVLARRAIVPQPPAVEWPAAAIAVTALALLLWTRKVPEPAVILGAGLVGLLVKHAAGT